MEATEGLEISKQAPASTFVVHLAQDWPQMTTRRAWQSLQRKGTRVAPGQTQGQGGKGHLALIHAEVQIKEHRSVQVAQRRKPGSGGGEGVQGA